MTDEKEKKELEVAELDDGDLDDVVGGVAGKDNEVCPKNTGNCVAGCGCNQ